jgi:hypothetical protein
MLLAFPDMTDELLARLTAALEHAPRSGPVVEAAPEKPKASKEDDTVYSKVPLAESVAARPAPEPARRVEATRTNGTRRPKRSSSLLWIPIVLALGVAGVLGYLRYEDWLERQGNPAPKVVQGSVHVVKRSPVATPEADKPKVDPRYTAYVAPAREAAQALQAGDAPALEARLAAAEKAVGTLAPEPASLHGLRAGRQALRLRDTALDNIGTVRSLEGVAWGKGSNTPYRTKESFLKAQEARISVTKSTSAELANAALAVLTSADPWAAESDSALQDRIERTARMLELSQ